VVSRTVYVPIAQDPENAARRRLQGKMRAHVRRAREKGLPYEKVDAVVLWKRDGGRCGICGEPVALEAMWPDHIVPTSRNGPTLYSNMRTACEPCNRRKYNYLDEELGIVDLSGASQANHPRSL
jgi:5-methylcytosine-specific restriction endonuclease McrA